MSSASRAKAVGHGASRRRSRRRVERAQQGRLAPKGYRDSVSMVRTVTKALLGHLELRGQRERLEVQDPRALPAYLALREKRGKRGSQDPQEPPESLGPRVLQAQPEPQGHRDLLARQEPTAKM